MKVIATKAGFFGKVRTTGEVFDVPNGTKGSWFAPHADLRQPAGDTETDGDPSRNPVRQKNGQKS